MRRDICLTLEEMGIEPQYSQHISGPGQNRIDFAPGPALPCADNVITFRSVVKMMAARNGLWATFSPKPLLEEAGNGFRIAMRPTKDGEPCADAFLAGILQRFLEMQVFFAPRRNLTSAWAPLGPRQPVLGRHGRGSLLRRKAGGRIELSAADGAANPYLCFALLLYAGAQGVEQGLALQPASGEPLAAPCAKPRPGAGRASSCGAAAPGDPPCVRRVLRGDGPCWSWAGEKYLPQWERLLRECGFPQTERAASGGEARRLLLSGDWDLLLIAAPLPDEFGHDLAADAAAQGLPVLLSVKAELWEEVSAGWRQRGCSPWAAFSKAVFAQAVGMLRASQARVGKLQAENKKLARSWRSCG